MLQKSQSLGRPGGWENQAQDILRSPAFQDHFEPVLKRFLSSDGMVQTPPRYEEGDGVNGREVVPGTTNSQGTLFKRTSNENHQSVDCR